MVSVANSEFNNILRTTLNQSGLGSMQFGESGLCFNDIAWFSNAVQGLGSDSTPEQKASVIQGMVDKAMSLIEKLTCQEAQAAKREVTQQTKAANDLNKSTKQTEAELQKNMGNIGNEIDKQSGVIEDSVKELDNAQNDMDKKQEVINKIIAEIQKKQVKLAETTDPAEQASILDEISGLSANISAVVASISDVQETVDEASAEEEAAVTEIETAKVNSVEIQENGQMKIEAQTQQAVQGVQTQQGTQMKGVQNDATQKAAEAAAQGASNAPFGLGAGAAAQLYRVSTDQGQAATTRKMGAVTNIQTVLQVFQQVASNVNLLGHFDSTIGSALNQFNNLITGSWNAKLPSIVEGFGSFTAAGSEVTAELDHAVAADKESVKSQLESAGAQGEPSAKDSIADAGQETEAVEETDPEATAEQGEATDYGLQTPTVELKKFEVQIGTEA